MGATEVIANVSSQWPLFGGTNLLLNGSTAYTWVQNIGNQQQKGLWAISLATSAATITPLGHLTVFTAAINTTTGVIYALAEGSSFSSLQVVSISPPYSAKTIKQIAEFGLYQVPAPTQSTLLNSQFIVPYTTPSLDQVFLSVDVNTGANTTVRRCCCVCLCWTCVLDALSRVRARLLTGASDSRSVLVLALSYLA